MTSSAPSIAPTTETAPPRQQRAAKHRREEGRQQPILANRRHGGAEARHQHQPGGRGEEARQEYARSMIARPTGTPESSAARALAPAARISRPNAVKRKSTTSAAPMDERDEQERRDEAPTHAAEGRDRRRQTVVDHGFVRMSIPPHEQASARQSDDEGVHAGTDDGDAIAQPSSAPSAARRQGERRRQRRAPVCR